MKHPHWIWAHDGETPYFYVDGEERPKSAARYVIASNYGDVLQELSRVAAERDALRQELDGVLKMIGDAPRDGNSPENPDSWKCPIGVDGCAKNCGSYGCGN